MAVTFALCTLGFIWDCFSLVLELTDSYSKTGHLKIKKNYKFERVENFRCLGVVLNEDNNNQIDLQEGIKNANRTYFVLQFFLNKSITKKLKLRLKNTTIDNFCIVLLLLCIVFTTFLYFYLVLVLL